MMLAPERTPISEPDARAARHILAVVPALRSLARAGEALGVGKHELLHAGPPLRGSPCAPIAHSAITAILFEAWADTADEAAALLRSGAVRLRPAQDRRCAVPLADVVSPSMWVQEICDLRSPASVAWSPLNGGAERVLRVGVLGDDVLEHLRWINGPFAHALRVALREPIPILALADAGLAGGDDCHGRTGVATSLLASQLEDRWSGADAAACRDFVRRAPSFFLNVWMAASKCMLDAARGVADASIIIAAGGNGTEFGIQIAAWPGTWFTAPAEPPAVAPGAIPAETFALGAIGDSAIVDFLGLGAMTTPTSGNAAEPPFADLLPEAVSAPRALLALAHPGFARTRPLVILPARRAIEAAQTPVVSLGVLDRAGARGRLAGGFYRPPIELIARAVSSLAR
jgi:hypothetical protein